MASERNNWATLPERTRDIVFDYLMEGNCKEDLVSLYIRALEQEDLEALVGEVMEAVEAFERGTLRLVTIRVPSEYSDQEVFDMLARICYEHAPSDKFVVEDVATTKE